MARSQWMFGLGVATLACLGGLLGGTAVYWSHQPQFPVYGYIFDAILAVVLLFSLIRLKRWKAAMSDEFMVVKKRFATQIGLMTGFGLYILFSVMPYLLPHAYRAVLAPLGSPYEGFNLGQAFGMMPFLLGLFIGQIAAWAKYR